ncbi:MAG TPA: exopolysaccharide biosynthesis polyprenyl glycosylphosphotransferase [Solirubrobacteraceae bacterium]|nr:exopolysaccharide biosynthesis polyprenyl glycosylphosphotransferase [Solirubrobacteraceae bacterium]
MSMGSGSDAENVLVWGAADATAAPHPQKAGLWDLRGPAASVRRDALFRRSLVAADLAAFVVALFLTVVLDGRTLAVGWACLLALPVIIVVAKVIGLYDRDESLLRKTTLDEAPRLLQLAALGAVMVWISGGLLVREGFDRRQAALLLGLLVLFLLVLRTLARAAALAASPPERCLVIGDELSAETIRAKLNGLSGVKAEVVARVDLDNVAPWTSETFSESRLNEVRDLAANLDVHRAVIAPRSADAGEMLNLVRTLKAVGVRVSVLPRLLEVVGSSVVFDDLHGVTVMGVRRFELTRSSALSKRALDLFGASLGLIAVAPLMAIIAVAIKLDSKGPVFFSQWRVGRHGKRFRMIKFRTMVENAEELKDSLRDRNESEGLFKIADDPRITRVGRILRRTALDELPQLFNILRGEMSLVGPRPLVADEDRQVEGWHRRRLELTPGMTGPWQILGPSRIPLKEMVAIDYLYVANWSLWTDVKLLLRTVPYVLNRRGL